MPLALKSDSQYAIKCRFSVSSYRSLLLIEGVGFTDWLPGWRRRNFTTSTGSPVKNVELIKYMDALLSARARSGQQVRLVHVRGHAGEEGNEGADGLAVSGAKLQEVEEPDWDALRLRLEEEPVGRTPSGLGSADASVSHS
jgi:ribonuclease HI